METPDGIGKVYYIAKAVPLAVVMFDDDFANARTYNIEILEPVEHSELESKYSKFSCFVCGIPLREDEKCHIDMEKRIVKADNGENLAFLMAIHTGDCWAIHEAYDG